MYLSFDGVTDTLSLSLITKLSLKLRTVWSDWLPRLNFTHDTVRPSGLFTLHSNVAFSPKLRSIVPDTSSIIFGPFSHSAKWTKRIWGRKKQINEIGFQSMNPQRTETLEMPRPRMCVRKRTGKYAMMPFWADKGYHKLAALYWLPLSDIFILFDSKISSESNFMLALNEYDLESYSILAGTTSHCISFPQTNS